MPFTPNIAKLESGIFCFNYHRVGEKSSTTGDENLFSCTSREFEMQLIYFKQHFTVIGMAELEAIRSLEYLNERYLLLTFDDGYCDNYQNAYPLLKKHGLTATFFVTTDYIDRKSNAVPWWDEVAQLVKSTNKKFIHMPFGSHKKVFVDNKSVAVKSILREFKDYRSLTMENKIKLLKLEVGRVDNEEFESEFMTWAQINEMSENGMEIGSHTCSHSIMSHVPQNIVKHEVEVSRQIIENRIGKKVESFAYPVGNKTSYDISVINYLKASGYKYAFTFEKGIITRETNDFELSRYPVNYGDSPLDLVKLAYFNQ